jgi:alkanesulfonate monooxygenase SsuD/methylene tetrahydromethanopterin reductase-like flavin-dependent oxidoreductase (luciferase family)
VCRQAEAAGAAALWAVDHLYWPRPMLECLTALTVAATATERATIGSCVVQVPLRSPAALAKQAGTLQTLTGGRFVLGVGAGSHPAEYRAAGVDFAGRGSLLDQGIDAMRAAWAASRATGEAAPGPHHRSPRGPTTSAPPYRQLPAPPGVPVWVGGSSAAARRRAAQRGDGWIPLFLGPEAFAEARRALWRETDTGGRDPAAVTPAVVVFAHVGPTDRALERGCRWLSSLYGLPAKAFTRHLIAGPASACAPQIERYFDAGARHVAVLVADDRAVEHFAALAAACRVGARDAGNQAAPSVGPGVHEHTGPSEPGPAPPANAGRTSAGRTSAGRMSAGRTSAGRMTSAGRTSAGRMSAGRMSAGRMSAGRMSAGWMSAGRMSAGWMSAGRMSAERMEVWT